MSDVLEQAQFIFDYTKKDKLRISDVLKVIDDVKKDEKYNYLSSDFFDGVIKNVKEYVPLEGKSYNFALFLNGEEYVPSKEINLTFEDTNTEVFEDTNTEVFEDVIVPKKDKTYVPWGCYNPLVTVFQSGKFLPILITGDTGNGKTMGVEQAAAATNRKLIIFNTTVETTEEDLIGHYILKDGDTVWQDGPVIKAMKSGAILCLDEIDQATTRILCLQTILQGKTYFNKKTNEVVNPRQGFTIVATANTKGRGDDSDRFIGAQIMNEAFLERFPITIDQEYPSKTIEKRILKNFIDNKTDIDNLVTWANQSRDAYLKGEGEACITTRRIVQIAQIYDVFEDLKVAIDYAISRFSNDIKEPLKILWERISYVDKPESPDPLDSLPTNNESLTV